MVEKTMVNEVHGLVHIIAKNWSKNWEYSKDPYVIVNDFQLFYIYIYMYISFVCITFNSELYINRLFNS